MPMLIRSNGLPASIGSRQRHPRAGNRDIGRPGNRPRHPAILSR